MPEKILCAAVWYDDGKQYYHNSNLPVNSGYVILCYRHYDFTGWLSKLECKRERWNVRLTEGFLTNKNRFVDRKEAFKIYHQTDQEGSLTSEDLYNG